MLTYNLDDRGDAPLYQYLYRRIRDDILSGVLSTGEKLPSRRSLADHLRVSVVTVETAYSQLEAEGYVYSRPRRGVYVDRVEQRPPRVQSGETVPPGIRNTVPGIRGAVPGADAPAHSAPWRLDLGSNRTDPALFPASAWARLVRRTLSEEDLLAVPPPQGVERLRQAIAANLREYRGLDTRPEQIVVGAGAEYLYILLAQLLGPSAVIALEDPGYPTIRLVYRKCGVPCVSVPMDRQGMGVEALSRSGATAAHVSPAHHYPTGVVTPIGRRHALLRWAGEGGRTETSQAENHFTGTPQTENHCTGTVQAGNRQERWIIEDDYDSEFRSAGRPLPAMASIDAAGRVIYMNTFSQTISPALRIGYMVLPPRLLETYRRELGFYACTVPALEQHVLARFLDEGHYERHLSRMRKEYRTRRTAVLEAFRACPYAHRIRIVEQGAGLHFLLRLDTLETDEILLRRGAEQGVRLRFLSQFAAVPNGDFARTLVVNYAPLPPDRLRSAVDLLGRVLFPDGQ